MSNVAVRALCFALIGLVATLGVLGQDSASQGTLSWDEVTVAPGTYPDSVVLFPRGSRELEYRFLDETGAPHTSFFLTLADGLQLHAPDNAEIRYHLALRHVGRPETTITGEYVLDTLAPEAPQLTPVPGLHTAPVKIAVPSDAPDTTVAVRVIDDRESRFAPLPVGGLQLSGESGTVRDYRIAAYAMDASGNRSSVTTYRYRIDRSRERTPKAEPLLSPRPGSYANEQILVLDDTGLTDISVTLQRPGAEDSELDYRELPAISGSGEFQVTVSGTERLTGEPYQREVSWTQTGAGSPPEQGRSTATVRLRPPDSRSRYTFEDRPVADSDPRWLRVAELTPPPDGTRPVAIRYRADSEMYDTRLFYLLDGRRAPAPDLAIGGDRETVTAYALADTELQWSQRTENGVTGYSPPVMGAADIDLSSVTADAIVVRARFPGGRWTQRIIATAEFRLAPPTSRKTMIDNGVTVSISPPGAGRVLTLVNARSGGRFLHIGGTSDVRWRPPTGFSAQLATEENPNDSTMIDRTPLAPPEVTVENTQLQLSGEGQIFFRLDGSPDTVYEGPVQLASIADARRQYRVDAYRILAGEISPTVTLHPVIDRRRPSVPTPQVVPGTRLRSGSFVSREESARIVFPSAYDDVQLHYEISPGGQALLPRADSPRVNDGIVLTTAENREVAWAVRVRARFPDQDRWSPVYQLTVTVDRRPPAAPVLASDPQNSGVISFEPPVEEAVSIWYRLRRTDPYQRYQGPITIDRDRLEAAMTISAFSRDTAGNRTDLAHSPTIAPLNQGPAPPQLSVNGRVADEPHIVLTREAILEALSPDNVRWRIQHVDSDGNNSQFQHVSEPFLLSRGTYRINAYRERETQRSRVVELLVTIDPARPKQPAAPYVSYASDGRSGTVYWAGSQSEQIFASLVTDPEAVPGTEPFSVSDGTLHWSIPAGASSVSLAYFSVGESGRRSETDIIQLEAARSRSPAELSGVSHGERYRTERVIEFEGEGEIRFTSTSDGSSPPSVRASSARYEEPIAVNAPVGDTTQFRLRHRTFDGNTAVSEERELSFVIDREPPPMPRLRGAASDGYYGQSRSVRLEAGESTDTVMYRLRSDASAPPNFVGYNGEEIRLVEDSRQPRHYQIEAYAIDQAGNRSTGIAAWHITIDATSLHVSATTGDDQSGTGSRLSPFASLGTALRRAAESSRNTIFIAQGDYAVSSADVAHLTAGAERVRLNLIGGYDPESWVADTVETSIELSDGHEILLFGTVRLERLSFSQPLRVDRDPTRDTGNYIELRDVEVITAGAEGVPGLVHTGDELFLFNTTISHGIQLENGSNFEVTGSSLGPVTVHGSSTAVIHDSIVAGARVTTGSTLVVSDSRITANRSIDIGGLVYVEESTLRIQSSALHATSEDPILLRGRAARIEISTSVLYAEGSRSAIAIRTRGGQLSLSETLIDVTTEGYGYGLFLRDSPAEIDGSAIIMRVAGDGIAVAAGDSPVSVNDSLLWISGVIAERAISATGIAVDGGGVDDLVIRRSSIFAHRAGGSSSAAVRLGMDGAARITDNSFGGWMYTLIRSTTADTWERSGRLRSVEDLDRSHFGGTNRSVATEPPPDRLRVPSIPNTAVPTALRDLRHAAGR